MLPECLPRIGLRFGLPKECDKICWYGRGSEETYADCKEGNLPGVYLQECGRKFISLWFRRKRKPRRYLLSFDSERKRSCLSVCGSAVKFGFSALYYSQEQLTKATHRAELRKEEQVTLILDHRQMGLGSASWGAECLEKDRLKPEPFSFCWKLFGLKK